MAEKPTYEELEQKAKELERECAKHKAAGSEVERQKGFYEAILDGFLDGVWVADNEDVIYYTNKGMEIIAGIPADQILGAQVLKDFPESTLEFFRPHYLKAKETLQPVYYDAVPVTNPANRQSYQSGWLIPRMKDDNFDGMICTVEDVTDRKNAEDALRKAHDKLERKAEGRTEELSKSNQQLKGEIEERKQAEEALRGSEERFRTSVDNMLDCFGIYSAIRDKSGRITDFQIEYVNKAACENNLMSKEEQIGKHLCELLPAHRESGLFDEYCRLVETGKPLSKESLTYEDLYKEKHLIRAFDIRASRLGDGFAAAWRNVTDQQRVEEALRESEERYRALIENTSDWIWEVDENGIYTYASPKIKDLLGYEPEEVIGKRLFDLMPADEAERVGGLFRDIVDSCEPFRGLENTNLHKDGRHVVLETSGVPILDADGNLIGYRGMDRDITARKQTEELLQKRRHDLGERVKELNCLYGISHLVEKPGISLEEILQGTVDLISPSWQYPEITCAQLILEDQTFETKNFNETIWKQTSDIIVHEEPAGVLTVCYLEERPKSDEGPFLKEERNLINAIAERLGRIIERTRAEVALRESETKHRSLVEQIPAAIYIAELDEANTILYISPQIETLLGFSQAEYRDDSDIWREQLHPEDRERVLVEVARSRENSKPLALEYRMLTRDGRVVWLLDESVIVQDAAGKPLYLQGLMFNVSERRQAEEHIRVLNQQLMKAQENERQMISCELHDQVAQDLSTLKITCETLLDNQSEVPCEVRQGLSELSRTLQKIIKTVRDLSYDLRPSSLDQLGLVRTVFQYCVDFSNKNGVSVDFSSAGMDSLSLDFDTEINLYRLIQEGLNNIKKHADASHVTIRLVATYPKIILRIEDDGKGFNVKDRLIAAFHEKRMGLRSMEERVGLLQGKMRIQSSQAKGTRILVEIPYKEKKGGS